MKTNNSLQNKILTHDQLQRKAAQWKMLSKTIVFTNGCFDILHAGHIASLNSAAQLADVLVVAVNSDASIKGLKGKNRPVNDENARALLLASLAMVDAVIVFSEPTPIKIIQAIRPDVLVKGGDYKVDDIAGAKEVIGWGGQVNINPIVEGYSTTAIIEKLQKG